MKFKKIKLFGIVLLVLLLGTGAYLVKERLQYPILIKTVHEIKVAARQASVQVSFSIPVLKVSYTTPLKVESTITIEAIDELLAKKIDEAVKKERELQSVDKYKMYLTNFTQYGILPPSTTELPLGIISPRWAKFPERVLIVYTIEKNTIKAYPKEFEKDIETISEIANVSISQAKSIVSRLNSGGYSISKESITENSKIRLLWFREGWDSSPTELNWSVSVEGSEKNIIIGYDSSGILKIQQVLERQRVNVIAGYLDLKEEFKPKTHQVLQLEGEIKGLKVDLEKAKKELLSKEPKASKRDISNATLFDVMYGNVKLESFTVPSAASGVFLGNIRASKEMDGWQYRGGIESHLLSGEFKGVILTNAHVATMSIDFYIMVSVDKEVMYIVFPAKSYVRYTQDSDMNGTPSQLLYYDGSPILSWDYDCAIMVTTAIPQYEGYKAVLGDSSSVQEGDPVIMVGNPAFMQKFLTSGVVSNTSYNILKSIWGEYILREGISKQHYNWIVNSNFWFDTPIGIGGTSGSGVWALGGKESGKVIALHNMGMVSSTSTIGSKYAFTLINTESLFPIKDMNKRIGDVVKSYTNKLFTDIPKYIDTYIVDEVFTELFKKHNYVEVSGMNGGIPINKVKQYLQERGLDPSTFGWNGVKSTYWIK